MKEKNLVFLSYFSVEFFCAIRTNKICKELLNWTEKRKKGKTSSRNTRSPNNHINLNVSYLLLIKIKTKVYETVSSDFIGRSSVPFHSKKEPMWEQKCDAYLYIIPWKTKTFQECRRQRYRWGTWFHKWLVW